MNKDIKLYLTALSKAVKRARKAQHLKQIDLADIANLETMSIKRAENPNLVDDLKLSTFIFIIRALNLDSNIVVYPELKEMQPTKSELLNFITTNCSEADCKFIFPAFKELVKMAHSTNLSDIRD